jgi:hypothetical protein
MAIPYLAIQKDTENDHLDQLLTCYGQIRPSRESMCFTEPRECVLHSTSRCIKVFVVHYTAHFGHRCLKLQFGQQFQVAWYTNESNLPSEM